MIKLVILLSTAAAALSDESHVIEKRQTQPYYNPTQPTYAQTQPYYNPARPTYPSTQPQTLLPRRPTQPTYAQSQPYYTNVQPTHAQHPFIAILRLENELSPDGSYHYAYETENGISAQENGQQRGTGEDAGTVAQGSYAYTSPEGIPVQVQYVADENGFHPSVVLSYSGRRPS